jgi:pimeloyl-ACP methyl ester carboxylesterase
LCVNDLCWQLPAGEAASSAADMGAELARTLGYVPLYLRYNTGLHIAENGRELALQLEQLLARWPQQVSELALIGYSMGGLVIRSACHVAETEGLAWRGRLRTLVCLASPHHGSPLERAGNLLDVLVGVSPYAAPFGQLFRLRSAGISDLRHGLAHPADIPTTDRFRRTPDRRTPLPLPADVRCYALAVTLAAQRSPLADRLTGDGLVPLRSALGQHEDPALCLRFGKANQAILHGINHMAVPRHQKVAALVLAWLAT